MAKPSSTWGGVYETLERRLPELDEKLRKRFDPLVGGSGFSDYRIHLGDFPPRIIISFRKGEWDKTKSGNFITNFSKPLESVIREIAEAQRLNYKRDYPGIYSLKPKKRPKTNISG